jgi:hypothetical protein
LMSKYVDELLVSELSRISIIKKRLN